MSTAFLLTTLVVVVTPGTGALFTIAAGLTRGRRVMAATLLVIVLYGLFAAAMRRQVLGRPRVMAWLRRTFAASYVLLAGRLAVQSR